MGACELELESPGGGETAGGGQWEEQKQLPGNSGRSLQGRRLQGTKEPANWQK